LGAKGLNDIVPQALALLNVEQRPSVTHQSGVQHFEALERAYSSAGVRARLLAFIEDMAAAYAEADLIICRAGAITVAEIATVGIASVLIPFPHAVDDHQTANARFLVDAGAAILLPQRDLSAERLARLLTGLDRERLRDMAGRARTLGKGDATRAVATACMELAG
jgi:UDP-N-acetylglucosamine--N-acetylmuramyl-(pentapeptide) pyrophosphoryl-undecaprenol N-acetylglucosamine transferase